MANVEYSGDPEATCYYDRLGVSRSTDQDKLTTVGKIAKREVHPDNSAADTKTAEVHFNRVNAAVNTLRDAEKRDAYDTFIDRFGTETGTEEYEQWVDSGRSVPADSWTSSSTKTDTSNKTNTNTSSQRQANNWDTGTATGSATEEDEPATDDSEKPTHDTSYGYQTTASETRSASQQHDPTRKEPYSEQAETQSTDSNATAANSEQNSHTANYVLNPVNTAMQRAVSTPLGVIFTTDAPESFSTRMYIVLATHWILSFLPTPSVLIFMLWCCLFIPFPRISIWLSGGIYVYLAVNFYIFQESYGVIFTGGVVLTTFIAIGYYVLVRGSSLDPYASVSSTHD